MDFITSLLISVDEKRDSYNFVLVIVDWLKKVIHYQLVKTIINIPGLVKVIINMVI